jgi:hypothetical protein
MIDKFDALWQDKLKPWLDERQDEQKSALKKFWTLFPICLGVGLAAMMFGLGQDWDPRIAFILPFLTGGLGWVIGISDLQELAEKIKRELLAEIARLSGFTYSLKPYMPSRYRRFREHQLIPHHDRKHFEDHFEGEINGADFELYEAHLEKRVRTKNGHRWVTVFRGVMIRISFPKKVEGVTVITRDKGWFNGLDGMGRESDGRKLKRIGLVDPKFEKIFEVYGDDQVLARYMLTPSFMERLLGLEKAFQGKNVSAAFDANSGKGELLISAETGDQFEVSSLFKPIPNKDKVMGVVDEIRLVTEIIDLLVEPAQFNEHGENKT